MIDVILFEALSFLGGIKILDIFTSGIADYLWRREVKKYLKEIKDKLDGLAQVDLLSSIDSLEEGIIELFRWFDKVTSFESRERTEANNDDISTAMSSSIVRKAWRAMEQFIQENENLETGSISFENAKKEFYTSRSKATDAFNNKNLSFENRLLAVKVKIVAKILECLDCPEEAIDFCTQYMKKLHQLEEVRKKFSLHIKGGWKAKLSNITDDRMKIIKPVMLLNRQLYDFIASIKDYNSHVLGWPTIELGEGQSFNPILDWRKISTTNSWGEELIASPNEFDFCTITGQCLKLINCWDVNCRGDIVYGSHNKISLYKPDDKLQKRGFKLDELQYEYPDHDETYISALSVDQEDNVYVIRMVAYFDEERVDKSFHIFDKDLSMKHKVDIQPSLDTRGCMYPDYRERVNHCLKIFHNNVVLLEVLKKPNTSKSCEVVIYDKNGVFRKRFIPQSHVNAMAISNKNEILLAGGNIIYFYTIKGSLIKTVSLSMHNIFDMAFHFGQGKLLILNSLSRAIIFDTDSKDEKELMQSNPSGYTVLKGHPSGLTLLAHGPVLFYKDSHLFRVLFI
ncbi:uncharacterized protein LOC124437027 [Xenia sp. Carnegie-2017]|uniref:uncharacterized protein LOC124437027 n=1 Tax=Xenia sp. Carnegie-2017 TaxID=2897299 RepID=UPI001F040E60|nr:uncharacterized protein LOC124437027 [Xenia sp. Carnegie-2017]